MADRLFDSIGETWRSCLSNMSDVKELIPEFYTNAEFLRNANDLPLGRMQAQALSPSSSSSGLPTLTILLASPLHPPFL